MQGADSDKAYLGLNYQDGVGGGDTDTFLGKISTVPRLVHHVYISFHRYNYTYITDREEPAKQMSNHNYTYTHIYIYIYM